MRTTTIEFSEHTVTKTDDPARMRIEVEKTRRAFTIGSDCGLFRVPEVLDYDETKGVVVFERIKGIGPIRKAVSWGDEYNTFAEMLGSCVALIHRRLTLPGDMIVPLPSELSMPGDDVFLHGDLSVCNICAGNHWPPIVILDWQMTPVHGGQATYGTRYFDLMWFIDNLLYRPTTQHLFGNPVAPVASKFLDAYFKEARLPCDAEEIAVYAKRFFRIKKPFRWMHSNWKTRIVLPRCHALAWSFLRSLTAASSGT